MYFFHQNDLVYPVYVSDEKFTSYIDLLSITDGNKSHYVYIRNLKIILNN